MGIEQKVLVRMENIVKEFPGVKALKGVNFDVRAGEVHALVGENGAGKSTLIKILMGVYQATSGDIYLEDGSQAKYKSPSEAQAAGMGCVYQDINMAMHLTVGENFFLGRMPKKGLFVDWKKVNEDTQTTLDDLKIDAKATDILRNLTVGQQEMVQIASVVHQDAKVVVFDEPTALLANEEVNQLF